MAALIPIFKKELHEETAITRKMFERIPDDKFDWKPHPKSMSIKNLATHIAELPSWIAMAIVRDGYDFAAEPLKQKDVNNNHELINYLNKMEELGDSHLRPEFEDKLTDKWIMRSGKVILREYNRAEVIRMALNQITHHRAQLGVYLRLLNIPIPGSYGPSADDH